MARNFDSLLKKASKLKLAGAKPADARKTLLNDGWSKHTVDRALWQVGLRDFKNPYSMHRAKRVVVVVVVVLVVVAVVSGSIYWDGRTRRAKERAATRTEELKQEIENRSVDVSQNTVSREGSGITFGYPVSWMLTDSSDPDQDVYSWHIEPPSNASIEREILKQHGEVPEDSEQSTARSLEIINNPLSRLLVTMTITVVKAPTHEIEPSAEAWREVADTLQDVAGVNIDEFEPVEINGYNGFRYSSSITLGESPINSTEYVYITPSSRIEVSVIPQSSLYDAEIDSIIASLGIN